MSYVTNVILVGSDMGDHGELLTEINRAYFGVPGHEHGGGAAHSASRGLVLVDEHAGGDKGWAGSVALGAINYLNAEHFIAYLRSLDSAPSDMQLMFRTDNADRYEVVDIFPDDGSEPLTQYQRDRLGLEQQ